MQYSGSAPKSRQIKNYVFRLAVREALTFKTTRKTLHGEFP
jgi:hypothetical protein